MFRVLTRIFVALAALLAMRIFFAAVRRAGQVDGGTPRGADRRVGGKPESAPASTGSRRPKRLDRASAEDVPFVDVEPEAAHRG